MDHAFTIGTLTRHIRTMLGALDPVLSGKPSAAILA
jgi:hypothetical protein